VPHLRHFDHLNTARFITFSSYHRYRLLTDSTVILVFLSELTALRARYRLRLFGYVVMPEHVHLVLHPPNGVELGRIVGELKSRSARKMLPLLRAHSGRRLERLVTGQGESSRLVFWQARCYDHNCRTAKAVREKIEYCHRNPVVRGLVSEPGDWLWSSYNWYAGAREVPLTMDEMEEGI
jgi:putative transposase